MTDPAVEPDVLAVYDNPTPYEVEDAEFAVGTVEETEPVDLEDQGGEPADWPSPPEWWTPDVHSDLAAASLVEDDDDAAPAAETLRGASINGFIVSSSPSYLGIRSLRVPGTLTFLPVRGDIGPLLIGAAQEWHHYIETLRPGWCWGYAFRAVTGGGGYSFHAAGIAVDLNAPLHPYGMTPYRNFNSGELATLRAIASKYGLRSGAFYNGTKDAMHLEVILSRSAALDRVRRLQAAKIIGVRKPPYRPWIDASNMRDAAARDHTRPPGKGLHERGTLIVEKALAREGLLDPRVSLDGYWGTTTQAAWHRWEKRLGYASADNTPGVPGLTALGKRQGFRVTP